MSDKKLTLPGVAEELIKNPEAIEIIKNKILELNEKDLHDSLEEAGAKYEAVATDIARTMIEENNQLNDTKMAEMVKNTEEREQTSETPMVDHLRYKLALFTGNHKLAAELGEKALGNYSSSDAAGGYLAPNEDAKTFLDLVNLDSNVLPHCAPPYTMKTNTMTIPTLTAGGNAYTVAESTTVGSTPFTEVDTTWGLATLTAYKHGVFQMATAELLDDSDPAFEAILQANMVRQVATYIDWGIFHGDNTAGYDGSGSLISGLEGDDVITTNTVNAGGAISFDDILSMRAKIQGYTKGMLKMFVNPAVQNQLAGIKDDNGRYIYDPTVRSAETPTIFGIPVIVNNRISSTLGGGSESVAFVGAFGESAIIGRKPEVRWIVDPFTYAQSTQVKFVLSTRIAFTVASEDHFGMINGITIA